MKKEVEKLLAKAQTIIENANFLLSDAQRWMKKDKIHALNQAWSARCDTSIMLIKLVTLHDYLPLSETLLRRTERTMIQLAELASMAFQLIGRI